MGPAFDPDEIREWDKTTSAPNPTLGACGGLLPFDASVRHRFPNFVVTEGWGQTGRYAQIQRMLGMGYDQMQSEAEFQITVVWRFVLAHRVQKKEDWEDDLALSATASQSEDPSTGGSIGGVSSRGRVDLTAINMRSLYGSHIWNDIDAVRKIRERDSDSNTDLDPADVSQLRIVEIGYC